MKIAAGGQGMRRIARRTARLKIRPIVICDVEQNARNGGPLMDRRLPLAGCIAPIALLVFTLLTPNSGFAQRKPDLAGDYTGLLGPYHVKLHVTLGRDGTLTGTADNPDAGLFGMPCTEFHVNGQAVSFTVPMVHGTWSGVTDANGTSLSGMWSQGMSPMPLNFTRVTTANAGDTAKTPAGAGGAEGGVPGPSATTFSSPSGMAVTQDEVSYDGSSFRITSMNGVPQNIVEMKPGRQPIATVIMPDGRMITPLMRNDPSYANRVNAVLKIYAANHGAANPPAPPPLEPAGTSQPAATAGSQQDLQSYEGSLGSLGDAKILLPGNAIQTPDGTLTNASDSNRVIVYFSRTHEKVSFSASKSSDHKDDVVVLAGNFGTARTSAYSAKTLGGQAAPQYTEYLIHFTGGNNNMKHMVLGGLKADTVDRAQPGASALGTNSRAHTASFTISTVDANGHVQEALSSRQLDDWMNTTAYSRGLHVDQRSARAAGLVVVGDQALVDQGKENPDLRHVKKEYGIGEAEKDDLRYYAFGAGGLDKPGAQEKRDQRVGATAGALGTTTPSTPSQP